ILDRSERLHEDLSYKIEFGSPRYGCSTSGGDDFRASSEGDIDHDSRLIADWHWLAPGRERLGCKGVWRHRTLERFTAARSKPWARVGAFGAITSSGRDSD